MQKIIKVGNKVTVILENGNVEERIVTEEEFKKLQKHIDKTIKEISKEIFNGNIELKPYY